MLSVPVSVSASAAAAANAGNSSGSGARSRWHCASFFGPYIRLLPASFDGSLPLAYSAHQLRQLAGSPVLAQALRVIRNTVKQYCYLYQVRRAAPRKPPSPPSVS